MVAQRKRRIDASIDLTPLIDVVFQLLIFLMVASNFQKPQPLVDLPSSPGESKPTASRKEKLTVTIMEDNSLLLDSEPVAEEALAQSVQAFVAQSGITTAEIRGDRVSDLGTFVTVMETLRSNGIESIGLVKEQEDADTP